MSVKIYGSKELIEETVKRYHEGGLDIDVVYNEGEEKT